MAAYTDSAPVTTELELEGVWIHDPSSAQDTGRHYPYGRSQRELAADAMGESSYYAGRERPVTDYGEHLATEFRVTVDVAHGADWRASLDDLRAFALGKRTVYVRDNRGRAIYAQLKGYREVDQSWGTQVSFTAVESHWTTETVT